MKEGVRGIGEERVKQLNIGDYNGESIMEY